MLLLEVLILEASTIDGLPTGTITTSEVTALDHELGDDSVEGGTFWGEGDEGKRWENGERERGEREVVGEWGIRKRKRKKKKKKKKRKKEKT